jgi:LacI family transcriptional regulator
MLWLTEPQFEHRMIRQIINNSVVDGIIVSSNYTEDPIVDSLTDSQMPFVLVGHHDNPRINSIDVDNVQAAFQATSLLINSKQPRKRVATITGPQNTTAGTDRFKGYCLALAQNELQLDNSLIVEGNFTDVSGYTAMQKLLPFQPDAVFAANDMMASGAYRAIREAGLNISRDVAVVGFDDVSIAIQLDPPLSTIRQPIQGIGTLAVNTLINLINKPEIPPAQIILQADLIIRGSCGNFPNPNTSEQRPAL